MNYKKFLFFFVGVLFFSACSNGGSNSTDGFNGQTWGTAIGNVRESEAPKEGSSFEINGSLEMTFEGTYLGITPDFETENEARLTYVFADSVLVGGYYYIFADYDKFTPSQYIEQVTNEFGEPSQSLSEDGGIDTKIWMTERSVVKIVVCDLSDKYQFEWYAYEAAWFNEHRDELGW